MGLAIDTVLGYVTNSASLTGVTFASGDSGAVRSFNPPATAMLEGIIRKGATAGQVRVKSPLFADDVSGITYGTKESPAQFLLPPNVGQQLTSQDTLTVQATSGAADSTIVALSNYYSNLSGTAARLHSWGDISGIVKAIKTVQVACTTSATIGTWVDTVITTTENLLHANTDYAVLGYVADTDVAVVGLKGSETGNLRICGPGASSTLDISNYFVELSDKHGTPHIPVINAANKDSVYVSVADNAASTAVNVYLVLAELTQNLAS